MRINIIDTLFAGHPSRDAISFLEALEIASKDLFEVVQCGSTHPTDEAQATIGLSVQITS